jgi:hypothetical protein
MHFHSHCHVITRTVFAYVVVSAITSANAEITVNFVDVGESIPGFGPAGIAGPTVGGGDLEHVVQAAADWWEDRLAITSHVITINFGWFPRNGSVAATAGPRTFYADGRVKTAAMVFDNDGITINDNGDAYSRPFFADPTPYWNEEFQGDLEIEFGIYNTVEVINGYRLQGSTTESGYSDLLSVALHELGHALGFVEGGNIKITDTRIHGNDGQSMKDVQLPVEEEEGHLRIGNSLMDDKYDVGYRTLISDVDAAAVAHQGGFNGTRSAEATADTGTGFFDDRIRWTFVGSGLNLVPDAMTSIRLGSGVDRHIGFRANQESKRLWVLSGEAILDFNAHRYRLHGFQTRSASEIASNFFNRALVVTGSSASSDGSNAVLRLREGLLNTPDAWIDGNPLNSAEFPTVIVEGNATLDVDTNQFYVGYQGQGKVQQQGQVNADTITVGSLDGSNGRYEMSAGNLYAGNLFVGQSGTGEFYQSGGNVTTDGTYGLRIAVNASGDGVYQLSEGTITVQSGTLDVGQYGHGLFRQSKQEINFPSQVSAPVVVLGRYANSYGEYALEGGSLTIGRYLYVGDIGEGRFLQEGGTVNVGDGLSLGVFAGSNGLYVAWGGTATFDKGIAVGRSGEGRLEVKANPPASTSGSIVVRSNLRVGTESGGSGTVAQDAGRLDISGNLDLTLASNTTANYYLRGGVLSVGGAINFGPGTENFSFTGGTLHVRTFNGDLNNQGGTLAPGNSVGTTTVNGNYTQATTGTLGIEIGNAGFDELNVDGIAQLAGTLDVSLLNGFTPSIGQQFKVLTADNCGFTACIVNNGMTLGGAAASIFDLIVGGTSVILQTISAGLPGDFNNDGTVDAADYVVWRKSNGTPQQYADWRANFGASSDGSSASSAISELAAPEPSSIVLLAFLWGPIVDTCRFFRRLPLASAS